MATKGRTTNQGCPNGKTKLPDGRIISKKAAHLLGYHVPNYSLPYIRDEVAEELGMTKVRGNLGGTYYE